MSTFKNRTWAANANEKLLARAQLLKFFSSVTIKIKKKHTITSTGAPPTGRGPS